MTSQRQINIVLQDIINTKKNDILDMFSLSSQNERELADKYTTIIEGRAEIISIAGLFGQKRFFADGKITIGSQSYIAEYKKVSKSKEYGY